ncbi:MAG: hypothetical protein CMC33_02150 [Flavobacteriaceae bacterium]|nr:hypothetical protein [Flavobacteriaceae bacterium]|tara:strand:+ start:2586 stop:2828 length:243 start_codon:yes stop_codon:yes gene_type:complete
MILNKKFSGAWNFGLDKFYSVEDILRYSIKKKLINQFKCKNNLEKIKKYYLELNVNKSKTRIKWKQKLDFNKSLDYTFSW